MGASTGFEPYIAGTEPTPPPVPKETSYVASARLKTRRLSLVAAIQHVQATQRMANRLVSSPQVGTVQRNHTCGSVLHLMRHTGNDAAGPRDNVHAAYAAAAYTQSQAEQWRLTGQGAAKARLSSIRSCMKKRRSTVRDGDATVRQACGFGGSNAAANIYAVLDELLELAAAGDGALLEAGLRRHAAVIRKGRGAVGETVLHLCFLFGSPAHKVEEASAPC